MEKRLFIVSNTLPIYIDNQQGIQRSSDALVSAIKSCLANGSLSSYSQVFWCGVPGGTANAWNAVSKEIQDSTFEYLPVFVTANQYNCYYNGHSGSVLWPLFHYFPSYAGYDSDSYECYKNVNKEFAQTLIKNLRPFDTVWIHDYHLLPLAAMLRKQIPDLTIGFFLHIPFPSFEIFRLLPKNWQTELLTGVLGADLIGFHTIDYAAHFLKTTLMVLGLDDDRNIIHYDNRLIKVDVFPMSIDYQKFNASFEDQQVIRKRNLLKKQLSGKKLIFSVDRLDYTKGIENRLKAYEHFLLQNPEYAEKVEFVLVIAPSRENIPKYTETRQSIEDLVADINKKFATSNWTPVIYQYANLESEDLIPLYGACDVALITPLRDGMNLVAKEFVASRFDKRGVLIISEMAGAARELTDAIVINPNDVLEMTQKIKEALEMPEDEQQMRLENMQRRIANYDVKIWAEDFMAELLNIKERQQSFQIKFLDGYSKSGVYDAYRTARKRLLLLDYDGTLVPFSPAPEMAVPGKDLLNLLNSLCKIKENEVVLISGRNSAWLDRQLCIPSLNLIAEHGARYKWRSDNWIDDLETNSEWKQQVHSIMEMYVRRCANTFIEEKDFSVVWHYRKADLEQGKLRAYELSCELKEYIHSRHLQVLMGNKIVEVRQSGINKGAFIKRIIESETYDFIFAVGDDRTDEDMFRVLGKKDNTYTIKVGPDASYAQYNLHTQPMVLSLLEGFKSFPSSVTTASNRI